MFAAWLMPRLDLAAQRKVLSVSRDGGDSLSKFQYHTVVRGDFFLLCCRNFPQCSLCALPHFSSVHHQGEFSYVFTAFMQWKTAVRSHLATFSIGRGKPIPSASPHRASAPAPCPLQGYSTKSPLVPQCPSPASEARA